MKSVLYTQRVEVVKEYNERRDCTDQRIPLFINKCGYLPIALPNVWDIARKIAEQIKPVGIVLTGGNSLVHYGGDAPERDEMERRLIEYAIEQGIALYGICRGMQVIEDYFGCKLQKADGHIAVYHKVMGNTGCFHVNSYHGLGCKSTEPLLEVLARAEDGTVEAVCSRQKKILGTMWHPEREMPFSESDIKRVRNLFENGDIKL